MADKNKCGCRCNSTSSVGDKFICINSMDTRLISNTRISGLFPWDVSGNAGFTGVYDWISLRTCFAGTVCTKESGNLLGSYVATTTATPVEVSSTLTGCSVTTYWTSDGPYYDSNQTTIPVGGAEITIQNGDFWFCKDFNITNTGSAAISGGITGSGANYYIDTSFSCNNNCVSTPEISGTRIVVQSEVYPSTPELTGTYSNIWKIFNNAPLDSGIYSWSGIGTGLTPSGIIPSP